MPKPAVFFLSSYLSIIYYFCFEKTRRLLPYQNEKVSCQNEKDGFQNGKSPLSK
jgi:hypothetical protein